MADLDQQLIAAFARMDKKSRYTWLEDDENKDAEWDVDRCKAVVRV